MLLQWSRGLSTAEGGLARGSYQLGVLLQWSRGLSTAEGRSTAALASGSSPCFNGAAVFRPRRATSTSWTATRGSCFNGAAVFRPRRDPRLHPLPREEVASMEPRSFDRGGEGRASTPAPPVLASMEPRSFDRGGSPPRWSVLSVLQLQWSRGLSTAEGARVRHRLAERADASMEPRSFDRGGPSRPRQRVFPSSRSLQWSRGLSTAEGLSNLRGRSRYLVGLQWSRGLSTAEGWRGQGRERRAPSRFNGAAVFRPRRGRVVVRRGAGLPRFNGAAVFRPRRAFGALRLCRADHRASMEPRSFDRGGQGGQGRSPPAPPGFNGAAVFRPRREYELIDPSTPEYKLQWSRGLSTAEGKNAVQGLNAQPLLQWSRGLSTAEGDPGGPTPSRPEEASMEPRSFDRGGRLPGV